MSLFNPAATLLQYPPPIDLPVTHPAFSDNIAWTFTDGQHHDQWANFEGAYEDPWVSILLSLISGRFWMLLERHIDSDELSQAWDERKEPLWSRYADQSESVLIQIKPSTKSTADTSQPKGGRSRRRSRVDIASSPRPESNSLPACDIPDDIDFEWLQGTPNNDLDAGFLSQLDNEAFAHKATFDTASDVMASEEAFPSLKLGAAGAPLMHNEAISQTPFLVPGLGMSGSSSDTLQTQVDLNEFCLPVDSQWPATDGTYNKDSGLFTNPVAFDEPLDDAMDFDLGAIDTWDAILPESEPLKVDFDIASSAQTPAESISSPSSTDDQDRLVSCTACHKVLKRRKLR